ncbi:MAG: hypothetical protein ACRDT6_28245 [Micromonosporaceae bacterium]
MPHAGRSGGGWWANLRGSLVVFAVIAGISYGLPAIDHALPDHRAIPSGIRIAVGHGVTVLPPPRSVQDSVETSPRDGRLVLEVSGARYAVDVSPYLGTLREAATRLLTRIAELPGYQLSGTPYPVATLDGVPGLAGRFSSARRDGFYAVYVTGGRLVEVVAHGVGFALSGTLSRVRQSVATIRFEATGVGP